MTAPDPGLTDLIAAALVRSSPNSIDTFDLLPYHRQEAWRVRAREIALVVEQHTNGRTAEVNARAKARVKAANKRASARITQIRTEEAARFEAEARAEKAEENARAWSETYRGGIRVRDEWRSRAEEYAATIANVRTLADVLSHSTMCAKLIDGPDEPCTCIVSHLRAALEGEQQ